MMSVIELIQSAVRDGVIPDREPSLLDSRWNALSLELTVQLRLDAPFFNLPCRCVSASILGHVKKTPVASLDLYRVQHLDYGRLAVWVGRCPECSTVYCAMQFVPAEKEPEALEKA